MNVDEFLRSVASEPPYTRERDVIVPHADLLREVKERGSMSLTDFQNDPRHRRERRTFRYGHLLGAPLSADEIRAWQRRWPRHILPGDLTALLMRVDGIHLWANLDTTRAYTGLAPLAEWELARTKMYGPTAAADLVAENYLALSYHADGADFVVLDVERGSYYLMGECGADESCRVGQSVEDLLDYWWSHRIRP
jgi:hypothetical protein